MSADVSQLRTLSADLTKAGPIAAAKAARVIRKTAFDIEASAKTAAPVDTGNLRNSIGTDISNGGLTAVIGPGAAYGIYVELGTSRMAAQPFLGPAYDRHSGPLVSAMADTAGGIL